MSEDLSNIPPFERSSMSPIKYNGWDTAHIHQRGRKDPTPEINAHTVQKNAIRSDKYVIDSTNKCVSEINGNLDGLNKWISASLIPAVRGDLAAREKRIQEAVSKLPNIVLQTEEFKKLKQKNEVHEQTIATLQLTIASLKERLSKLEEKAS